MFVAGVIACCGIIDFNGILIVGAMAVSPDLLPITAIGEGIVGRDAGLARRALSPLAVGMAVAAAAAWRVGLRNAAKAGGALAVLGTNVAMMVLGASAALAVQRRLVRARRPD